MVASVERSDCPGDRATETETDADRVELAEPFGRYEEHGHADEPGNEPADDEAARPTAGDHRVEDVEPDRHGGDHDRGDAGWDEQLREDDTAVSAEQQQRPDHRSGPPLRPLGRSQDVRRPSRAWANRMPSMISPAVAKRTPAARSGGIVSIITAIAKYVEPHRM